jgi:hypothetical protein
VKRLDARKKALRNLRGFEAEREQGIRSATGGLKAKKSSPVSRAKWFSFSHGTRFSRREDAIRPFSPWVEFRTGNETFLFSNFFVSIHFFSRFNCQKLHGSSDVR